MAEVWDSIPKAFYYASFCLRFFFYFWALLKGLLFCFFSLGFLSNSYYGINDRLPKRMGRRASKGEFSATFHHTWPLKKKTPKNPQVLGTGRFPLANRDFGAPSFLTHNHIRENVPIFSSDFRLQGTLIPWGTAAQGSPNDRNTKQKKLFLRFQSLAHPIFEALTCFCFIGSLIYFHLWGF